jgi:tRNA/rRNA methyltransferase
MTPSLQSRESVLAALRIVLVEPAGALNVGAIARVMKNMGLARLVLVNPHCDWVGEEARRMAVHAADVLAQAQVVASLPQALAGCQRAIATTARPRDTGDVLEDPRVALPWLLQRMELAKGNPEGDRPASTAALIFGPEDRGLSNAELAYAQRFVRIPSSDAYPSLNLAQSVAVCVYELRQWVLHPEPEPAIAVPLPTGELADLDDLEGYFEQLEALLLRVGYLYPHTATSRMDKLRRMAKRAALNPQEVAMLRGMVRQIEWALAQVEPPSPPAP